jgi:hypothetical protein
MSEISKRFLCDALGWGIGLWLIGYIFGVVFFMLVPVSLVGWVIMPIGIIITLWVLIKKINGSFRYFIVIGITWALIAVICDYIFLVQLFHPANGYYVLDVYLYYVLTLLLPIGVGRWKQTKTV